MTYSLDFRRKVLAVRRRDKLSFEAVAKLFSVGKQSVYNWSKRLEAKQTRDRPSTQIKLDAVKQDTTQYPDSYIYERAQRLGMSTSGVHRALKRLGYTYKKNSQAPED